MIGQNINMSLSQNKTEQLWRQFIPRIKEIENKLSRNRISLQIYPESYYEKFNANTEFEKWATVEVKNFNTIPIGMDSLIIIGGLYAVFDYKPQFDLRKNNLKALILLNIKSYN